MEGMLAITLIIGSIILYESIVVYLIKKQQINTKMLFLSSIAGGIIMMSLVTILMVLDNGTNSLDLTRLMKIGAFFFTITVIGSIAQWIFILSVLRKK